MRLRIISDGRSTGTRVVDEDTGEEVERVARCEWELDATTRIAQATITVLDVGVDVVGYVAERRLGEPTLRDIDAAAYAIGQASDVHLTPDQLDRLARAALASQPVEVQV